jgi:outer membrane protein
MREPLSSVNHRQFIGAAPFATTVIRAITPVKQRSLTDMTHPAAGAFIAVSLAQALPAAAAAEPLSLPRTERISAEAMFRLAEAAERQGDLIVAEQAYRALTSDADLERRTEARFRLALLLADRLGRVREGAVLLRRILDDKPGATRVRLELARLHAKLGDRGSAERELRAVEASGLPPDVERIVRFFRQSLNAEKSMGGSIEVALAPDSNINRATRSDTLGTVIGEFEIDRAVKARSGIGVTVRGQAYARVRLSDGAALLLRGNLAANLYGDAHLNDVRAGLEAGPELRSGSDRLTLLGSVAWQWHGNSLSSRSLGAAAAWQHALGPKAQLRLDAGVNLRDNLLNPLDEGWGYSGAATVDRAFSATFGGGVQLSHGRLKARSPAYATTLNGASIYAYKELGRTTLVASAGYTRLEADAALALFPRKRIDHRVSTSIAATLRSATIWGLAPLVRLRWDRNSSTVELYDYSRRAVELGVTTAF